jgi:SAM-dependent methyltransferase
MICAFYPTAPPIYFVRIKYGVKHVVKTTFNLLRETKPFTSPRTNILELRRILSDCSSILDVGCGRSSPLRFVSANLLVGVDVYRKELEEAKKLKTHDEFVLADAAKLREYFKPDQFDACVALDVIEHFTKEDGLRFLHELETIAKRKVVVFTPNAFLPQSSHEEGDHQEHLSGWETGEMRELGYRIIGLDGLKSLRRNHHQLRFRPAPVWAIVSWISQKIWCREHPDSAAALLCWKKL